MQTNAPVSMLGDVEVHLARREVVRSGKTTKLTGREADLLAYLMERSNRVVTRAEILKDVWGHATQSTLYTTLQRLRAKIGDDVESPVLLQTVHGVGIRLVTDAPFSARPAASSVRSNLPNSQDVMIGREPEIAHVRDVLERERLVTIRGPGGVGKTRLAYAVGAAEAAGPRFREVWSVEAYPTRGKSDLIQALGRIFEVSAADDAGAIDRIARALAPRGDMLVILDNLEHVVDAAASIVTDLLALAPGLRVLATSRERMALAREVVVDLAPLSSDDALGLLLVRGHRSLDAMTASDREAHRALTERLDRMPLAIELLAPRLEAISAKDLLDALPAGLGPYLADTRRDLPERQRTIQNAIEWSWQLLSEPHRAAAEALALLRGAFTLQDARALIGGDAPLLVSRLVETCIVRVVTDEMGALRYAMLATIREFALERLETSSGRHAAEDRFLAWCMDEESGAVPAGLSLPGTIVNLHTAFEIALARRLDAAASVAIRLCQALLLAGPMGDVAGITERVFAVLPDMGPGLQGELLRARAVASRNVKDVRSELRHALDVAQGDPAVQGDILAELAGACVVLGGNEEAREAAVRAVEHGTRFELERVAIHGKRWLAILERREGRTDAAVALCLEALHACRSIGYRLIEPELLTLLGEFRVQAGERSEALCLFGEAIRTARLLGDRRNEIRVASLMAINGFEVRLGSWEEVLAAQAQTLAAVRDLGDSWLELRVHTVTGYLAMQRGRNDEAIRSLETTYRLAEALGDARTASVCLATLAYVYVDEGRLTEARATLVEAHARQEGLGLFRFMGFTASVRAAIELIEGHWEEARKQVDEAFEWLKGHRDAEARAQCCAFSACIRLVMGEGMQAAADLDIGFATARAPDTVLFILAARVAAALAEGDPPKARRLLDAIVWGDFELDPRSARVGVFLEDWVSSPTANRTPTPSPPAGEGPFSVLCLSAVRKALG